MKNQLPRREQRGIKWIIFNFLAASGGELTPERLEVEKRKEFRKVLGELGFKIENSTKDSNQIYIFNARLVPEEEMNEK